MNAGATRRPPSDPMPTAGIISRSSQNQSGAGQV